MLRGRYKTLKTLLLTHCKCQPRRSEDAFLSFHILWLGLDSCFSCEALLGMLLENLQEAAEWNSWVSVGAALGRPIRPGTNIRTGAFTACRGRNGTLVAMPRGTLPARQRSSRKYAVGVGAEPSTTKTRQVLLQALLRQSRVLLLLRAATSPQRRKGGAKKEKEDKAHKRTHKEKQKRKEQAQTWGRLAISKPGSSEAQAGPQAAVKWRGLRRSWSCQATAASEWARRLQTCVGALRSQKLAAGLHGGLFFSGSNGYRLYLPSQSHGVPPPRVPSDANSSKWQKNLPVAGFGSVWMCEICRYLKHDSTKFIYIRLLYQKNYVGEVSAGSLQYTFFLMVLVATLSLVVVSGGRRNVAMLRWDRICLVFFHVLLGSDVSANLFFVFLGFSAFAAMSVVETEGTQQWHVNCAIATCPPAAMAGCMESIGRVVIAWTWRRCCTATWAMQINKAGA